MKIFLTTLSVCFLICVFTISNAQTKKIANASHNSKEATFNWNTSDNLGMVIDYEKIHKAFDSSQINVDTTEQQRLDSILGIKSRSGDTIFLIDQRVDEEVQKYDTKETEVSEKKNRKSKKVRKSKKTETASLNENFSQDSDLLKHEIHNTYVRNTNETSNSNMSWMFLLLLPIGYVMFKKS